MHSLTQVGSARSPLPFPLESHAHGKQACGPTCSRFRQFSPQQLNLALVTRDGLLELCDRRVGLLQLLLQAPHELRKLNHIDSSVLHWVCG